MNLDRNSIIGFVLLAILMFVFFWYTGKQQQSYVQNQKHIEDSIARVKALSNQFNNPVARLDSLHKDSAEKVSAAGNFSTAALGNEQLVSVENESIKATFSNKGGRLVSVQLKKYKSFDGKQVQLGSNKDDLGYTVNTGNTTTPVNNLFFTPSGITTNADGSQTINFILKDSVSGQSIVHQYIIKPDTYAIDWNINLTGADKLLSNGTVNFAWKAEPQQHEKSLKYERQMSNICFSEDGSFDYISSHSEKKFEKPVQWLGIVQQFFNETLIAKNGFETGQVSWARSTNDSVTTLSNVDAALQLKVPAAASVNIPMQLYFGPNDYYVLKKQGAAKMDKIVNLGRDMYTFIRPVNEYIIMPVFNFLSGLVSNIGWAILLLTFFVRIITTPLTYRSYLSGAKMKALRPELDALKIKYPDQQAYAMEQMKVFRETGVNMLGGCIPALVQLPVFVALYSFFNSNIAVRGHSFLWASDLSLYDSIIRFPFTIPLLGNHLSLFTILAVAGQFFLSVYNMSMTPQTADNPAMKYMPYIFPFMMLFFFNNLPSALTWYYTVSNLTIVIQQVIIQRFIIDHDKILAQLNEKRKQPKKKSKWQERMEQIQESQKKIQELKNKTQQNKK